MYLASLSGLYILSLQSHASLLLEDHNRKFMIVYHSQNIVKLGSLLFSLALSLVTLAPPSSLSPLLALPEFFKHETQKRNIVFFQVCFVGTILVAWVRIAQAGTSPLL